MSALSPFTPQYGKTLVISATTSSSSITLNDTSSNQLVITNAGTNLVFVKVGTGAVTATSADLPILPGAAIVVSRPQDNTVVAGITAASTSTVYVTPGYGE